MTREPAAAAPQTDKQTPQQGDADLPPVSPDDPLVPDPAQPEPLPLPPDTNPSPAAPVREPDQSPPPAGDPPQSEPTRLAGQ